LHPPVNYTRSGTIDHVGDRWRIVLNEQIENPDGSLTVNAAHMFLLGPIAVGEMIIGSSTCGVHPDVPTSKEQCKNAGYVRYGFSNRGACVSFVATRRGS
jgi:hypothetical protein